MGLPAYQALLLCALALSLGWGIRGTITGNERGAMLPGALAGFCACLVLYATPASLSDPEFHIRLILSAAAGACGFSFGGITTHGETMRFLEHPSSPRDYIHGAIGAAIKGAVWMGLGGAITGISAGSVDYTLFEAIILAVLLFLAYIAGKAVFNKPFSPPEKLPRFYFSITREESWGGIIFMFLTVIAFSGLYKVDPGPAFLGLPAFIGGGIGYPLFESVNAGLSRRGIRLKYMDYWKIVEFGLGAAGGLGLGVGALMLRASGFLPPLLTANPIKTHHFAAAAIPWLSAAILCESVFAAALASRYTQTGAPSAFEAYILRHSKPIRRVYYAYIPLIFILSGEYRAAAILLLPLMLWITSSHAALEHSRHLPRGICYSCFLFAIPVLSLIPLIKYMRGAGDARALITAITAIHIALSAFVFLCERSRAEKLTLRDLLSMSRAKTILLYMLVCFAVICAVIFNL